MKVSFEGHQGLLWSNDDNVIFYGVRFNTISDAIKQVLRHVRPSTSYRPWCSGRHRGLLDMETGKIFVQERWFDNEKVAELYLKHVAV
jgi:hypothetical protein